MCDVKSPIFGTAATFDTFFSAGADGKLAQRVISDTPLNAVLIKGSFIICCKCIVLIIYIFGVHKGMKLLASIAISKMLRALSTASKENHFLLSFVERTAVFNSGM
jgi:hypothetical protein